MYAVGVCCKRGEWIFSMYMCRGDAYPTLKVRRVKHAEVEAFKSALKFPFDEVFEVVRRFGKT
jgi:hypothetical protein